MKLKKILINVFICVGLLAAVQAEAAEFWRTGNITRVLTDRFYGGCMINLSVFIENGCPIAGWVSLDCEDKYSPPGTGNRMYAMALTAFSLNKRVSVLVNNTEKHNGYCVARRVDMLSD